MNIYIFYKTHTVICFPNHPWYFLTSHLKLNYTKPLGKQSVIPTQRKLSRYHAAITLSALVCSRWASHPPSSRARRAFPRGRKSRTRSFNSTDPPLAAVLYQQHRCAVSFWIYWLALFPPRWQITKVLTTPRGFLREKFNFFVIIFSSCCFLVRRRLWKPLLYCVLIRYEGFSSKERLNYKPNRCSVILTRINV